MRKILILLLLSIVFIPLSARTYTVRLYDSSNTSHDVSLSESSGTWVGTVDGSTMSSWVKEGKIWYNVLVVEQSVTNTYYHSNSQTSVVNGTSYTYYHYNEGSGATDYITWSSDYSSKLFTFTATSGDSDFATVDLTISWADNVYTSSVYLLGTINSWSGTAYPVEWQSGSEWKLSLTKAQVEGALDNGGDFNFRFIENMNTGIQYGVYPNVDQTSLTVNGSYTSDTYATTNTTTDEKMDYYWKFTPTGADNYTIWFNHDGATRSVKVTDDLIVAKNVTLRTSADDAWGGKSYDEFDSRTGIYTWYINSLSQFVSGYHEFKLEQGGTWYGYNGTVAAGSESSWTSFSSADNNNARATFTVNSKKYVKLRAKENGSNWDVQVIEENDAPHEYYWVSPQITNGEKWPSFKLVPSRNRYWGGSYVIGDGLISTKYYTFTIKDDDLVTWKTKSKIAANTAIQWYIVRDDDVVVYRPASDLPVNDSPASYDDDHPGTGSHDSYVSYKNYWNGSSYAGATAYMTTSASYNEGSWSFSKGSAKAHTFNLNAEKGHVLYNYTTSGHSDSGYRLAGNWTADVEVTIAITDDQTKLMTAWYYKDGAASTDYVAAADSVVYKVSVDKPGTGWGGLYLLIHPNSESTNWSDNPNVLRPLITLNNNLDGRALHGALTTANSDQSLNPEASSNYLGYTFSFNATTMTYRLEFHTPDATLKPGAEDGNVDFKGSVSEDIAVALTDGSDDIHTKATQYAIGFGADAYFDLSETNKYTDTKFNLSFNGSTNEITYTSAGNNYTGTVSGSSIYVKVRGFDSSGNYGDIHIYKYTFHSSIGFEPHGGLFINSAKIKIEGGVPPYRYEIWHYNTKTENGETVIDYTTGTRRSSGTFSNTAYNADDDNFRISTPGFLKIIDSNNDEVSFEEVGGGFDFTYSTSENYKPYYNNTDGGYSTINADDAGAYPNGADYWLSAPGDLSYKLDPTWGGSSSISDESSEVLDWKGEATKHVNNGAGLSQTVTGLNTDGTKTYTVQAIVRGKGEKNKTVTLTLEGADIVTKTVKLRNSLGGKEDDADLSRNGSEVTRTGRVEYIEPMTFSSTGYGYATGDDYYKQAGTGWVKVEAKAKANDSGQLTIKIKGEDDENGWFNLSTVTLLEDANTTHGFRTTASATATEVGTGTGTPYDYRARNITSGWKQNNAYSFFDRGKNRNAVIFANNRTVIAMDKSLLAPECPNRDIDRRHPFNVVGSDEDDSTDGVAKALYLTDMGYGGNVNNPVDYKIGTKGADGFNSPGYKDSGYTFMPIYGFLAENVILDRTPGVSEKDQTTIMLPFSITVSELKQYYGNDLQVWDYTGFDLDTRKVRLSEVADKLIANKPYMLTGANGTLDSRNVAAYRNNPRRIAPVSYTLHHSANTTHSGFSGTYEYITVSREDENKTETHYGFRATEGTFTIASESGAKLKPFRAYFTLPMSYAQLKEKLGIAESRTFSIVFDADATTGITQTEEVRLAPANVYNINGVLMNSVGNLEGLPKGIYIMNGKKFVVK